MKRPYFKNVHTKKNTARGLQHGPRQEPGRDKEEDEAGPAPHRTREKLNMRKHVLDMSGFTLVQCTNHDEGCATDASLQVATHAAKKKSPASDKKTSNSVLPTRERHQMSDAALRELAQTALG